MARIKHPLYGWGTVVEVLDANPSSNPNSRCEPGDYVVRMRFGRHVDPVVCVVGVSCPVEGASQLARMVRALILAAVVAVVSLGSGVTQACAQPDVAPVQGKGSEERPRRVRWESPCEMNPWVLPPPWPAPPGQRWCWTEVPELV